MPRRADRFSGPFPPLAAAASLIAACVVVSGKKLFWMDELFTFLEVSAPTLRDAIGAAASAADSSPPLYPALAWSWARLFGDGETSLRLLGSLCVAGAFAVTWNLLRRTFGGVAATFGAGAALCAAPLVLTHNAEARPYGLFLLLAAIAVDLYERHGRRPRIATLVAWALVHAALVHTHVFGFVYGGALAFAGIVRDVVEGRRRLAFYLAVPLGWATFAWWWKPLLIDMDVCRPHNWIEPPTLARLMDAFGNTTPIALALGVVAAVAALRGRREADAGSASAVAVAEAPPTEAIAAETAAAPTDDPAPARRLFAAAATFVFVVPLAVFVESRLATSIFLDRYFIPGAVGWAILLAAAARRLGGFGDPDAGRAARIVAAASCVAWLAFPAVDAALAPPKVSTGFPRAAAKHPDLPVVFEAPQAYLPSFHYEPERARCFYVLDWEAALAEGNARNATVDYKLLQGVKSLRPEHNIVPGDAFLASHPRFLVADVPARRWSELRVESNPDYRCTPVDGALLVERVAAAQSR
ncbi:MAG TPA: glycosyltransferase family 39 protein [Planctomycetota bacterium]|nr:glycosyltransferase family 39 protein [Planctomycetota bacterium]